MPIVPGGTDTLDFYGGYRSLKELRVELQQRLGFGNAGAAANVNMGILNSFLRDAQEELYWLADWTEVKAHNDYTTPSNGTRLAYDDEMNINRILNIAVDLGTGGQEDWRDLKEGIDTRHYSVMATQGWPQRYSRFSDGIEIFPYRDRTYDLRIHFIRKLARFSEDGDEPSVPDGLIFVFALAMAKAHYRHPDAQLYANRVENLKGRIMRSAFGNERFLPKNQREPEPEPRPVVV